MSLLSGLGAGSVRRLSGKVLRTTCRVVGAQGTKAASGRLFLIWLIRMQSLDFLCLLASVKNVPVTCLESVHGG